MFSLLLESSRASKQNSAVDLQCPALSFTRSTPVDSQESTAILLWVLPNGNESLGVRPRQGVGVRMRRSGEDGGNSSWRHTNGFGGRWVPDLRVQARQGWEEPLTSFWPTSTCLGHKPKIQAGEETCPRSVMQTVSDRARLQSHGLGNG